MFKFWLGITATGDQAIYFEQNDVISVVKYSENTDGFTSDALFAFSVNKLKESGLIAKDVPITTAPASGV